MPTLNKLEYLDETKQQIKNALNTNFNSQIQDTDTFRSYVTKIKNIYSNWPKVTDEDSQINLTPTRKGKMNLPLKSTELIQDGTPTPDNPVDVNVIKSENNVKLENNNLLNFTFTDTVTRNGITFTKNNDGSLTLNGTATTTFSQVFNITHQVLNGTYTIKHNVIGGTTSENSYLSIQKSPSGNISDRVYGETTSSTLNITEDTTIVTASIYIPTGTVFTDYNVGSQLEKGSTATNYVKHQEQNYPITLDDLEYCKIGNYADQIFKNTTNSPYYDNTLIENEWYLKKNIGKVVLDGTQTITYEKIGSYDAFKYNATDMKSANIGAGFSNYYLNLNKTSSASDGIVRFGWINTNIYFYNDVSSFNGSIDNFKTWLSTHNTEVYYPLATSTYIHISQEDYPVLREQLENLYNNAKSYDGQTNITQTNDNLPFIINASALMKGDNLHE